MTGNTDTRITSEAADSMAGGVKTRVRLLVLAGMVIVALVFGCTFYFALVSNQSALAAQVPGLEAVAAKLKSLLIMNTVVFIAIIIASFFALASIVTSRMFRPLALLHRNLLSLADGKLPRSFEASERGAFSPLDDAFQTALSSIYDRERKEIEELTACAETLARTAATQEPARVLRELAARKSARLGAAEPRGTAKEQEAKEDQIFIQPL
jgi:methyl-accepting chemotaxis protein